MNEIPKEQDMAEDFRKLLKEANRSDDWGRYFEDIVVQGFLVLSAQASSVHASTPEETLEDVNGYTAWQVALSQNGKRTLTQKGYGAWDELSRKPWATHFTPHEIDGIMEAEFVPTEVVQQIYEDLLAWKKEPWTGD